MTRTIWASIAVVSAGSILFTLLIVFQCVPLQKAYMLNMPEGKCLDMYVLGWAWAGFDMASDLWITFLPFPSVLKLRMPLVRRLGVMILFSLGLMCCAIAAGRTHAVSIIVAANSNHDVTYGGTLVLIWSQVEACVGLMCACVPSLRIPFTRLFQVPLFASRRSISHGNAFQPPPRSSSFRAPEKPYSTHISIPPAPAPALEIYRNPLYVGPQRDDRPMGLFASVNSLPRKYPQLGSDGLSPPPTPMTPYPARVKDGRNRTFKRPAYVRVSSHAPPSAPISPVSASMISPAFAPPLEDFETDTISPRGTNFDDVEKLDRGRKRDYGRRTRADVAAPLSPGFDHEQEVSNLFTRRR